MHIIRGWFAVSLPTCDPGGLSLIGGFLLPGKVLFNLSLVGNFIS